MITTSFVRSRRQATDGDGWAADHHEIRMPGPARRRLIRAGDRVAATPPATAAAVVRC